MPREFDCCECGRHIIAIIPGPKDDFRLCASCLMTPGWFTDPRLRAILDPDHDGRHAGGLDAIATTEKRS